MGEILSKEEKNIIHILCLANAKRLFSGIACQKVLIVSDVVDHCKKQYKTVRFFEGTNLLGGDFSSKRASRKPISGKPITHFV